MQAKENDMFKKKSAALILLLSISAIGVLSACNTIQGAGKDIERGGEKIQDTAQEAK